MSAVALSPRLWIHLLFFRPIVRLFFGVSVRGKENLNAVDRFVIAANHNSHLDVLILFSILPARHIVRTRPVAAWDYFSRRKGLFALVDFVFRPIWIDREGREGNPLDVMRRALDRGQNLILFPEGTRGEPGLLGRFRSGVGRLLELHQDVPAVPVFLAGPEKALPRHAVVPLPLWNVVTVGPPQVFATGSHDITVALEGMIRELSESESASRHRRIERPRTSFSAAVVGIDGSGKSTLSAAIARELSTRERVCRISDALEFYERGMPREIQPLTSETLRQALGRRAKSAKSLKRYKIPKLAELLLRDRLMGEVRRWYAPEVLVLDGAPLINVAAWARIYKGDAFDAATCAATLRILTGRAGLEGDREALSRLPELKALRRMGLARLRMPHALIFLDVPPAVSMARIEVRGGVRQVHETAEELTRLREGYLMVCDVVGTRLGVPVLILDGRPDLETLLGSTLEFIGGIRGKEVRNGSRGH